MAWLKYCLHKYSNLIKTHKRRTSASQSIKSLLQLAQFDLILSRMLYLGGPRTQASLIMHCIASFTKHKQWIFSCALRYTSTFLWDQIFPLLCCFSSLILTTYSTCSCLHLSTHFSYYITVDLLFLAVSITVVLSLQLFDMICCCSSSWKQIAAESK